MLVESQTSQGTPNSGVEEKDKAVKKAGSVDNPIVTDSSSEGLLLVVRPAGTSDVSANAALKCTASDSCANVAQPMKTEGIVTYSSSKDNSGARLEFSTGVKEHSSPIVMSSTEEAEEICPRAYESSGMEVQEGSVSPHKRPEQVVTLDSIKMEGLKCPTHSRADGSGRIEWLAGPNA